MEDKPYTHKLKKKIKEGLKHRYGAKNYRHARHFLKSYLKDQIIKIPARSGESPTWMWKEDPESKYHYPIVWELGIWILLKSDDDPELVLALTAPDSFKRYLADTVRPSYRKTLTY